jgi:signal transduction histidine kinase
MDQQVIRVLLIEDDEDDYVLTKDLLSEVTPWKLDLDWASTFKEGLDKARNGEHDVYLLDYRLGERDGLDLLREFQRHDCKAPVILLTGQGDREVDLEAMMAGAVDYLEKDQISVQVLERAIRYAIERKRVEEVLRESEKQLKMLSSKLLEAQETERKLVAQELHDGITGALVGIKFSLESKLLQMGESRDPLPGISLEKIIVMVQNALEELGRISTRLRPAILDDLGILATIRWYCQGIQSTYPGICIEEKLEVLEDDVPDSLKVAIYRISQEALNNVTKHSKADRVTLCLKKAGDRLELCINDNGQGFELRDISAKFGTPEGMGLTSMKERTEFSGGSFAVSSAKGAGTSIRATWKVGMNQ